MMPLLETQELPTAETDTELIEEWAQNISVHALGLPSDLSIDDRNRICGTSSLVDVEVALRHAEAFEALESVRASIRSLDALNRESLVQLRHQSQQTRSARLVQSKILRKDTGISTYNRARDCLEALGVLSNESLRNYYPRLTLADTTRRNPVHRREVGDSRLNDGRAWHPLVPPSLPRLRVGQSTNVQPLSSSSSGTRRNIGEQSWKHHRCHLVLTCPSQRFQLPLVLQVLVRLLRRTLSVSVLSVMPARRQKMWISGGSGSLGVDRFVIGMTMRWIPWKMKIGRMKVIEYSGSELRQNSFVGSNNSSANISSFSGLSDLSEFTPCGGASGANNLLSIPVFELLHFDKRTFT